MCRRPIARRPTKRLVRLLATFALALSCVAGCGTNTTPAPPDMTALPDLTPLPDLTRLPDLTKIIGCGGGLTCAGKCADQTCQQECFDSINSDNGAQLLTNVNTCFGTALQGSCKASCPDPTKPTQACATCTRGACTTQLAACSADK